MSTGIGLKSGFRKFLLPGLVFQSVIVGGGYGTGREIAEFFLGHGAVGGLLGMVVAALAWSLVLAVAFEYARIKRSYDYRSFFQSLLGKYWFVFESIYVLIAVLVLAVLGSAAGAMVQDVMGVAQIYGILFLLGAIGALAYFGSAVIERVLAAWSMLLYLVYAILLVWVINAFGDEITRAFSTSETAGAWHVDGLRYAAYNLNALAAVLFVLPYLNTRGEAVKSGLAAGLIGIFPGIFVFIAMLSQYPSIGDEPVPVTRLLHSIDAMWFLLVFQLVLFGTFIETGAGIVHAINERVADAFREKDRVFPQWIRACIALAALSTAIFLANWIGIVDLIAKGYGLLSYAFIVVVILPLLTVGLVRILKTSRETDARLDG